MIAVDRHMADGRKRQVRGHQRLAMLRQLAQKTDPDAACSNPTANTCALSGYAWGVDRKRALLDREASQCAWVSRPPEPNV